MEQDRIPEEFKAPSAVSSNWSVAAVVLFAGLAILGLAYVRERRHAAQLAADNSQIAAALSQTQSQVETLTARVNTMALQAVPTAPSPSMSSTQPAPEETHPPTARKTALKARRPRVVESQRWKKIDNQLGEQQKAIANTQQDLEKARTEWEARLSSAHDELNGSIARTHDELVALEKKGERSYYEFDLEKSKQFQRVGPLSLSLRKANVKHEYYDLAMVVDDRQLSKKHVNLFEPLLIYPADSHLALEVVVNQISKDGAHGYVSAPRSTETQNAASGVAGTAATTATGGNAKGSTTNGDSFQTRESLSHRPSEQPL